jgi:hypothetical protein
MKPRQQSLQQLINLLLEARDAMENAKAAYCVPRGDWLAAGILVNQGDEDAEQYQFWSDQAKRIKEEIFRQLPGG